MAGRTPYEAVSNYVAPLQLAISCVTVAVLDVSGGYYVNDTPHALAMNRGAPVRLDSDPPVWLSVIQHYRIVEYEGPHGPWKTSIVAYYYSLSDSNDQEIIAYHWHPRQQNPITFPHIHLGQSAHVDREDLANAHLPTGRVALEDVLRLAIHDFDVEPRRTDWSEILDRTQSAYEEWRTWP